MKTLLSVVGVLFFLGAGAFLVKIVFFPVHTAQKEIELAYDTVDQTINADNAIYNYEWFKQKKEDIDATRNKLDNSRKTLDNFENSAGERATWTFEDKQEHARLSSIVLGTENYLEQQIADYNARSKMANRNIFQNSILPDYIDALTFIRK